MPPAPIEGTRAPVLFLVFNRLDTTQRVFEAIRAARPPRLYVAADGARKNKQGEAARVQEVRDHILQRIDWPCEVKTLLREENLGCKLAVGGGIGWFFEHEAEGIILEDDCLPAPDFFPFCETLLARYRDDASVAGITGDFKAVDLGKAADHYGTVRFPLIWGWASWRRAWQGYDRTLSEWTGELSSLPALLNMPRGTQRYFTMEFDRTKAGELNTWDYQFTFLVLKNGRSFLHPHVNLISNLGFTGLATNTADPDHPFSELPTGQVRFPLRPTPTDVGYTEWLQANVFNVAPLHRKVLRRISRWRKPKRSAS
jgi:hypothetical protein